jgi:hypothetical protein
MSCPDCREFDCPACQVENLHEQVRELEAINNNWAPRIAELEAERDKLFDSLRTQKHLNEQLGAWLNKAIAERDSWEIKAIDLAQGVLDYQEGKCDHYHLKKLVGRICPQ